MIFFTSTQSAPADPRGQQVPLLGLGIRQKYEPHAVKDIDFDIRAAGNLAGKGPARRDWSVGLGMDYARETLSYWGWPGSWAEEQL